MPDLTMCAGAACPIKDECYRHTAKPTRYRDENGEWREFQSYFASPPFKGKTRRKLQTLGARREACAYYWPNDVAEAGGVA